MEPRFSDRIGITKPPAIQISSVSPALRHSIWNLLIGVLGTHGDEWKLAARFLAASFFKVPADSLPMQGYECREVVKTWYYKLQWYEVLNFLEFVSQGHYDLGHGRIISDRFIDEADIVLAREASGYRFINKRLEPISNETEIQAITDALKESSKPGLEGVRFHLAKALDLLAQRPNPDHHNVIKEAITAVEAAVKLIARTHSGGLKDALTELTKKVPLTPAMTQAFLKLYGYTSGPEGIRHPMLEEASVGFDEAKFMILACSGFVNYLIAKASSAGLLAH